MLPSTPNELLYIQAFRDYVLPILPIIYPVDITSLWAKFTHDLLPPIELACLNLIIETGSWISNIKRHSTFGNVISTHQLRSPNIASAARCIQEQKYPSLDLIQACLLMSFFLQENAQSYDYYLNKAVDYLRVITDHSEVVQTQSEKISLLWLSLSCIKLESPNTKTFQLLAPIIRIQEFPSDQRLSEVFGTPFANEQRHRLQWVEDHLDKPWRPYDFHTQVDEIRLQTYVQVEIMKANLLVCGTEEIIGAHAKFVLAAQCLDAVDRVRNLQKEVKSLLYLKDKMDFQSWFKLSQRTCGYLLIFSPLTGDLTVSYQNLLVALRLWPVPTSV